MRFVYSQNISELIQRSISPFECCTFPSLVRHKIDLMNPTANRPYIFLYPMLIYMDEDLDIIGRAEVTVKIIPRVNSSYIVTDAGIKLERCEYEKYNRYTICDQSEGGYYPHRAGLWA